MHLQSNRLLYSPFTSEEFDDFYSWYGNDAVMKQVMGRTLTLEEAKARFEYALALNEEHNNAGLFSVKLKESQTFMGIVKFTYLKKTRVEIGYGSLPPYWGKGYATEMLQCLIQHALNFPEIKQLIGIVSPGNAASIKVLTKQGFSFHKESKTEDYSLHYKLKLDHSN